EHVADGFGSAMKDRCVLEIEKSQSTEWLRFPVTNYSPLLARDNLLFQLPGKKVAKMYAEQVFKLLKIRVVTAGSGKRFFVLPGRKKLLHLIPFVKEGVPLGFWLERSGRSAAIPVNPQFWKTGSAIQLIEH